MPIDVEQTLLTLTQTCAEIKTSLNDQYDRLWNGNGVIPALLKTNIEFIAQQNGLRQKLSADQDALRTKVEADQKALEEKIAAEHETLRQKVADDQASLRQKVNTDQTALKDAVNAMESARKERRAYIIGYSAGISTAITFLFTLLLKWILSKFNVHI